MFDDRHDAGEQLADLLETADADPDVVLAIPRGALPVGRVVADRLGAPLDVVVASKMGAPNNEELAVGAAASDGSVWRNDDLVERLGISEDYLSAEHDREAENAREKLARYRGEAAPPDLEGLDVLIVDDGVATGATMRACIQQARAAGAGSVAVGVPVGSPDSIAELRDVADAVHVVETPADFRAVGYQYRTFPQVSDEEALGYLDE